MSPDDLHPWAKVGPSRHQAPKFEIKPQNFGPPIHPSWKFHHLGCLCMILHCHHDSQQGSFAPSPGSQRIYRRTDIFLDTENSPRPPLTSKEDFAHLGVLGKDAISFQKGWVSHQGQHLTRCAMLDKWNSRKELEEEKETLAERFSSWIWLI